MPYTNVTGKTIDEYRDLFNETYCNPSNPIITFDGIKVKFYSDQFNHAFYESRDWRRADKSIFSNDRAEKILWIKDALEDVTAIKKVGWDKRKNSYDTSRRVAIVKTNYVVIIHIINQEEAKFISAFEADNSIDKILNSPDWV